MADWESADNQLPVALKLFCSRHPRINVTVHDVLNEHVVDMVRDRRVELGVVLEPDSLDGMTFKPFFTDRFMAVVPPDSPLCASKKAVV